MALVPFEMLEGQIDIIKTIEVGQAQIEKHYEDEQGNRSIVLMPKLTWEGQRCRSCGAALIRGRCPVDRKDCGR